MDYHRLILLCTALVIQQSSSRGGGRGGSRTPVVGEWTDTTWSDNPFMVKLDVNIGGYSYICGGSIIATDEWNGKGVILTAAHCLEGARDVNIWVGCTQTNCRDDLAKGYGNDHWVVHPDYDESLATDDVRWCNNDVALIFLKRPINVEGATSISLYKELDLQNDEEITVFGYYGSCLGNPDCVGGSDVDSLEYALTNYMISSECDNVFGRHVSGPHDFCIKDDFRGDGLQSACMGDSGSPAVIDGKQIGLNSWGPGDCDPQYPTVLTSVPYYYEWIAEQCPECVAGDTDDQDEGEGECTGLESKWDRGCSRKVTEESCVGVRRGTVCQWVTKSAIHMDHGTLPERAAFSVNHMVSFGENAVNGNDILGLISPLHLILLSALVLMVIAILVQIYSWWRERRRRMGYGYRSLFVADKYYEDEQREYDTFSSPITPIQESE